MEALSQKFVEKVAREKGVGLPEATKMIDRCMKIASAELNIPYSEMYSVIYNDEYLSHCVKKDCSELELEECRRSCFCVEFEGQCVPKRFPNADEINKDPDKFIKKLSTVELERAVRLASFLHYNYGSSGLTDNSFDALEYFLKKKIRLKGRAYEKIGAEPIERIRTKLPFPLPSLKKVYPGTNELLKILRENPMMSWSLKLDGVSGMVIYADGEIAGIYTRGNGTVGGDITFVKDYITFPKVSGDMVVRGEFIISKRKWLEKYSSEYSNARNFVSGKINSGFISPALPDISFIAYEIISGEEAPSQAFKILGAQGWDVVDNGLLNNPTVFELMQLYKEKRESSEFYIDGLVLTADVSRATVLEGSRLSIAFKMQLEEQIRESKVLDVEWNISRYGRYVPVAIFESVYISGSRLHRATAHNAAHIRDWSMGSGTKITVIRSGDVIPTIKDVTVDESIEPIMPSIPPEGYDWHWEKSNIVLNEIDTNREVQIKRIVHFFSTIGVPRLKDKTAEKMWEADMRSPEDIASASSIDFQQIRGIGKKTADFLYEKIHERLRRTPVDRYLIASTTLQVGLGRKLIKTLFSNFPDIFTYSEEEILLAFKKKKVKGFGAKRIKNVAENLPKFKTYLYSFAEQEIEEAIRYNREKLERLREKGYNPKIENKTFVLSGFHGKIEYDFEDYIYDNQGLFSSTVTSQTEAVIVSNILEITKKMEKAHSLGVKVLSMEEFKSAYNVKV